MTRSLVVGDTHANQSWMAMIVVPIARHLNVDRIIQVGDFGWWNANSAFVNACRDLGIELWWLDGNHEDHERLKVDLTAARARLGITDMTAAVDLGNGIIYMPRGHRFELDGVSIAVMGGARSIDRTMRTPGFDWFLDEMITDEDLVRLGTGHADIMLTHDTISGYTIPGLLSDADIPREWISERPACDEHRMRLREAVEAVTPSLLIHGHYHVAYVRDLEEAWGPLEIVGLNCDGEENSMIVLETNEGAYEWHSVSWQTR